MGHLLRVLALKQAKQQASPLHTQHIEGKLNNMADAASRSYVDKCFTESNKPFLSIFNSLFPIQKNYWQEYKPNTKMSSQVTLCLLGKQLTMEWWKQTATKENAQNMYDFSRKIPSLQTAQMHKVLFNLIRTL